jgi:hypothetical protein
VTRKTVLSVVFLSVTGVAVGMEIWFAVDGNPDTWPWTEWIADQVPAPITFAAIAVLLSWLPGHFAAAYSKRGKTMATTTIPATPDPGAAKEPLVNPTVITAAVAALIDVIVAFGVDLTDAQTTAILAFVPIAALIVLAVWARRKVFSPATARAMVVTAARTGEVATEPAVVRAEVPPGAGERLA